MTKDSIAFTPTDWDAHYARLAKLAETGGEPHYSPQSPEAVAQLAAWYDAPGRDSED